jgi:hypothetical protein
MTARSTMRGIDAFNDRFVAYPPSPQHVPPHFEGAHAMSVMRLTDMRLDPEFQPRAEIDRGVLLEDGQLLADGVQFPPVVVFRDAEVNWLTDGFHRWHAHKAVGLDTIEVRIIEGAP